MAFCTQCGSPVDGAFCSKCGAKAAIPGGADVAPPPPPLPPRSPAAQPIIIPPPSAPTPRKGRLIFWVLGGCLLLVIVVLVVLFSTGLFIAHKTGLDLDLMQRDPNLAVAKMIATANPDIEVLSVDKESGIIRVRDRKTGKEMSLDLKDVRNGKIVFMDDQSRRVEIQSRGEGKDSSLVIRSDVDGEVNAAVSGGLPDWLPAYPGATAVSPKVLRSTDSIEAIGSFYESALKRAGFEVRRTSAGEAAIMLSASDPKSARSAEVSAARVGADTIINLEYDAQ